MKRLCSIATVAFIAVGASAQHSGRSPLPTLDQFQPNQPVHGLMHHPAAQLDGQREVLFTEDFANGFAGNNGGLGAWTLTGTNGDVWRYTTTGPVGAYTVVSEIITSPSAANGFMLFNSDSVNTNFGVTPPVAISPRVSVSGSLISPIMDLSGPSAVEIRFYEQYRFCCANTGSGQTLDVSLDGGQTWPNSLDIDQGLSYKIEFTTAEVAVNLTPALGSGDRSQVRLRFTQGGDISAYYWEIDDISISALPENELIMDYGYTAQFGEGYEYGRIPQSQIQSTVNVGAGIINYGGTTQNNVTVYVSLKDDATNTEVGASTINLGTINTTDTMIADAQMTVPFPLPVGKYTAYFTMTSDSIGVDANPNNNAQNRYFEVTNDLYALDAYNVVPNDILALTRLGTSSFTDNTQDVRLMNLFIIESTTTFYGVEIRMATQSAPGSYFIAAVYDTADVMTGNGNNPTPLVESDPRVITQADYNSRLASVSFLDAITLNPGAYYVSANLYQEGGNDLSILDDVTVPQPWDASMIYIPIDDQNQNTYSNGNAFCIRLSSELNVGVQEAPGLDGITMYPSPTSGPLHVQATTAGKMSVEVFNALGAQVQTANFTGTMTDLDLSGNAAGIYTVRVGDGTNFNIQRILLK